MNATENAILCLPGSLDCPSKPDQVEAGKFVCEQPAETDADGVLWCLCESGLCYEINAPQKAASRLLELLIGRVRLWYEVYSVSDPRTVVEKGSMDLTVSKTTGAVTGILYADPMSKGSKLNWFRFSPMILEGQRVIG